MSAADAPRRGVLNRYVQAVARLSGGKRALAVFLLGGIGALALPPVGAWVLFPLALGLTSTIFAQATNARQAAATGWAFAAGYFGAGLSWIMEPFWVDAARHGWMAPFALIFLAGGLALFWGVAFGVAHWLGRGPATRIAALILTVPVAEYARAHVLTGFPWAAPSQIWVDWAAAQWLAYLGPHGLTLLTVLVAVMPGLALARGVGAPLILASVLPLLMIVAGGRIILGLLPDTGLTGQVVRLVQPNAPQDQKWHPDHIQTFFTRQIGYTAADPRPDLIVWPETAVPSLLNTADRALGFIADAAQGVPVVLGIQRREAGQYFNSLIHLDDQGQVAGVYDKHHLVPFGEYIPLAPLATRLGIAGLAQRAEGGYAAGPGPELMSLPLGNALPLICYEAVFPQDTRIRGARPDFLMQITNDAWFGQRSGPYQHLAQAQMRAIEQGLPLLRAANTGVSAMIDPYGRITDQLPLGQAGYVDAELPLPRTPTLYARTGDLPVLFLFFVVAIGFLWRRTRHATAK